MNPIVGDLFQPQSKLSKGLEGSCRSTHESLLLFYRGVSGEIIDQRYSRGERKSFSSALLFFSLLISSFLFFSIACSCTRCVAFRPHGTTCSAGLSCVTNNVCRLLRWQCLPHVHIVGCGSRYVRIRRCFPLLRPHICRVHDWATCWFSDLILAVLPTKYAVNGCAAPFLVFDRQQK